MAGSQNIADLNVRLNLELNRLDAQITQANAKINRLTRSMQSDFAKAAKNINATLGSLGVGIGVGAIASIGKSILDLGSKISDLSSEAGISTTAFQALSLTASESGVSGEQVTQSFVRMRKSIQDAVEGSKPLNESFAKLGLSAAGLAALAPERQFEFIARAVQNATDKSQAFNAALEIMGKTSPKLKELFEKLSTDGIDGLEKAKAASILTPDEVAAIDKAGDTLGNQWDKALAKAAKAVLFMERHKSTIARFNILLPGVDISGGSSATATVPTKPAITSDLSSSIGIPIGAKANAKADAEDAYVRATNEAKRIAESNKAFDDAVISRKALLAEIEKGNAAALKEAEAQKRVNEELERQAEAFRFIVDPSLRFRKEIEQVNKLLDAGKLEVDEATDAIAALNREMAKDQTARIGEALDDFFKDLDEKSTTLGSKTDRTTDQARELGFAFSSAFEDAIFSGEKFSKVLKGLETDILRVIIRRQVTEKLAGFLTSGKTWSAVAGIFGGFHADGGRPDMGKVSVVGEKGPELFVPDVAGRIVPNDKLGGTTRGGDTYHFEYNIPAGVTREELVPILRAQEKRTIGTLMSQKQRGKKGL